MAAATPPPATATAAAPSPAALYDQYTSIEKYYSLFDGEVHRLNIPRQAEAALPTMEEERVRVNMLQKIAEGSDSAVFKLVYDGVPYAAKYSKQASLCCHTSPRSLMVPRCVL